MKLHTAEELKQLLAAAVKSVGLSSSFHIDQVEAPLATAGWVTMTFSMGGLVARLERDRGEIDVYFLSHTNEWHNLNYLHRFLNRHQADVSPVKSMELFDPGYSEDAAILDAITTASRLLAATKSLFQSREAYAEFLAFVTHLQS